MASEHISKEACILVGMDPDKPIADSTLGTMKTLTASMLSGLIAIRDLRGPQSRHASMAIRAFEDAIMYCEKVFK